MQYTILINQTKALEWGLNLPQATLFSFLYGVPSWAHEKLFDDRVFYNIAKSKVTTELPLLTDKTDTVYRQMKKLVAEGLIEMELDGNDTYIRITEKGKGWAMDYPESEPARSRVGKKSEPGSGSEKNPSSAPEGRKIIRDKVGKKSEQGSEKNPTNHITNNQITSDQCEGEPPHSQPPRSAHFDSQPMFWDWEPDSEILIPALARSAIPVLVAEQLALDVELVGNFRNHQLANPGRDCSANSWTLKLASWLQRDWQRLNRPKTPDEYRSARGFDLHPTPAGGHHAPRQRGYVMSATEAAIARGEQPKVPPGYVPPAGFAAPQPGAPVGNVYDADRG